MCSSSLYTPLTNLVHLAPFANAALPPQPRLQTSYPLSTHFVSPASAPSVLPHVSSCFPVLPAFSSSRDLPRVLLWITGGLLAISAKLLHFISLHFVHLICIQESNLNSFSSFTPPCSLFLTFMLPLFALWRIAEPTSFPLHSPLLQKSFHSGKLHCHYPFWDSRSTSDPRCDEGNQLGRLL